MKKYREAELEIVKFEDSIFTYSWCQPFACSIFSCDTVCLDCPEQTPNPAQAECRDFGVVY